VFVAEEKYVLQLPYDKRGGGRRPWACPGSNTFADIHRSAHLQLNRSNPARDGH